MTLETSSILARNIRAAHTLEGTRVRHRVGGWTGTIYARISAAYPLGVRQDDSGALYLLKDDEFEIVEQTIWIVQEQDYDWTPPIAAFSTKAAADAFVSDAVYRAKKQHARRPVWNVDEYPLDPTSCRDPIFDGEYGGPARLTLAN